MSETTNQTGDQAPEENPARELDLQATVLRIYTGLMALRPAWARCLVLGDALSPLGQTLAMASNIAGALSISAESDPALLRGALRSGACDFVVNSTDEALRTLKNEARKGLPLSVGVEGDAAKIFDDLADRGVLPALVVLNHRQGDARPGSTHESACRRFRQWGASEVHMQDLLHGPAPVLEPLQSIRTVSFKDLSAARDFDRAALDLLAPSDDARRRWLTVAPRVLPRSESRRRALWLTADEFASLEGRGLGLETSLPGHV